MPQAINELKKAYKSGSVKAAQVSEEIQQAARNAASKGLTFVDVRMGLVGNQESGRVATLRKQGVEVVSYCDSGEMGHALRGWGKPVPRGTRGLLQQCRKLYLAALHAATLEAPHVFAQVIQDCKKAADRGQAIYTWHFEVHRDDWGRNHHFPVTPLVLEMLEKEPGLEVRSADRFFSPKSHATLSGWAA